MVRAARIAALSVVLAGACSRPFGDDGTSSTPPISEEGGAPPVFIAFGTHFQNFRTWAELDSEGPAYGTVPADVLGPRRLYLNKLPPKGSTEFPIGTIIVEARYRTSQSIFAAVKRGGGFNATGAPGWEWFELLETPDVVIKWRGVGPPDGETYGGDPTGGCNSCHAQFKGNDYIAAKQLQLSSL